MMETAVLFIYYFSGIKKMRQFKLDKIKATGTTVGDVHFPKVTLLLSCNGSDNSAIFTDSSKYGRTASVTNGTNISAAQSKFGGTSMYFDGSADNIFYAGGSHWDQVGAHTIELWARFDDLSNDRILYTHGNNANNSAFRIFYDSANNTISVKSWIVGSSVHSTTTTAVDTWYHVAWVKENASVGKLYINGTIEGSTTSYANHTPSTSHYMVIGTNYDTNYGNWWTNYDMYGYIDDFRITKGLARYTSNFTPPTSAHLTQAGDVNKHIVVNSDADGVAIGTGGINQARIAKAWANIDGSQAAASMIQSSYNISSMTDHGTGIYSFNFSTAMTDAHYAVTTGMGHVVDAGVSIPELLIQNQTTALVKLNARYSTGSNAQANYDYNTCCMTVFGN